MAEQGFLAAYLAVGADEFKRRFVLERLEGRMAALGDLDFNKDVFSGPSAEADALVAACNTLPFACEYRLVVVRDADKLPKQSSEALVEYLAAPSPTTVVCFEATKLAKSTRLYKAIAAVGKKAVIDCAPKKRWELPEQVMGFAASEGVKITKDAAEELVELVGESTVHLDMELKKLAAALGAGAVIDVEQVRSRVARTAEAKPWHFTDALGMRDAKRCMELKARMSSQSPHGLLARSVSLVRELMIAKDLGGAGQAALAEALGKPAWQVKNHARMAAGFTASELENALADAARTEAGMKSGGDADMLFEQWVLGVCTRRAA